jgi:hypothetical protein
MKTLRCLDTHLAVLKRVLTAFQSLTHRLTALGTHPHQVPHGLHHHWRGNQTHTESLGTHPHKGPPSWSEHHWREECVDDGWLKQPHMAESEWTLRLAGG